MNGQNQVMDEKDDFGGMKCCEKPDWEYELLSVCTCGQKRELLYCKNCNRPIQHFGHIGCGAPDDFLRIYREAHSKGTREPE